MCCRQCGSEAFVKSVRSQSVMRWIRICYDKFISEIEEIAVDTIYLYSNKKISNLALKNS